MPDSMAPADARSSARQFHCHVCGHDRCHVLDLPFPELSAEWDLSAEEIDYIRLQQALFCAACGSNWRSIALALALRRYLRLDAPLRPALAQGGPAGLRVLEINEAGMLTPALRQCPGHRLVGYPGVDMQRLPFADGAFDVVVHSDTIEHVADPLAGLNECRRVLAPGGALIFTAPVIVGRLSRGRAGRPPSFHGPRPPVDDGYLVHTEFGADLWTYVLRAGFDNLRVDAVSYPAAMAYTAIRT